MGGEKGSGEKGREMRRKGDEHEQAWARKTLAAIRTRVRKNA